MINAWSTRDQAQTSVEQAESELDRVVADLDAYEVDPGCNGAACALLHDRLYRAIAAAEEELEDELGALEAAQRAVDGLEARGKKRPTRNQYVLA